MRTLPHEPFIRVVSSEWRTWLVRMESTGLAFIDAGTCRIIEHLNPRRILLIQFQRQGAHPFLRDRCTLQMAWTSASFVPAPSNSGGAGATRFRLCAEPNCPEDRQQFWR